VLGKERRGESSQPFPVRERRKKGGNLQNFNRRKKKVNDLTAAVTAILWEKKKNVVVGPTAHQQKQKKSLPRATTYVTKKSAYLALPSSRKETQPAHHSLSGLRQRSITTEKKCPLQERLHQRKKSKNLTTQEPGSSGQGGP